MSEDGVCIFGEVLFDHFPDGHSVLGGAPFNVAWHLQAFGLDPRFISRIGDDREGGEVLVSMQTWGMNCDGVQVDAKLPTGRVDIHFDSIGEPAYDIVHPCAYDAIEETGGGNSGLLLYHGTLALRDERSRLALERLKEGHGGKVFVDVNLRPPWWQREQVLALLEDADWVKLNGDELTQLVPNSSADEFVVEHDLEGLVLTHGAAGAEIVTAEADPVRIAPKHSTSVVDSVGAGDAFAAVTLLGLVSGWPLEMTAERAQDFASRLVGRRGATVNDIAFYRDTMDGWGGNELD